VLSNLSFTLHKTLVLMKAIFIQGDFKNIQGLLGKIQGLFKDITQISNFQGFFKDVFITHYHTPPPPPPHPQKGK